jgi:hypothetical protein
VRSFHAAAHACRQQYIQLYAILPFIPAAVTMWPYLEAKAMETWQKVCFILETYVIQADSTLGHPTLSQEQLAQQQIEA